MASINCTEIYGIILKGAEQFVIRALWRTNAKTSLIVPVILRSDGLTVNEETGRSPKLGSKDS
jgi:hypothetical protein